MNSVKVSVIMPACNVAAYIGQAVESVLAQRGASFELLIGDDASTDGTWDRISAYRSDPRVKAWCFKTRQGPGGVANRLIRRHARGVYLSSCDADDRMLSGHLRVLARVLDRHPRVGVVYGDLLRMEASGKCRRLPRSRGPTQTWDLIDGSIARGGTLIRRSVFDQAGGYPTQLPFLEDVEFFLRLSEITRFHYHSGRPLYLYRKRSGSLSDQPPQAWAAMGRKIWREAIFRRYGFKVPW